MLQYQKGRYCFEIGEIIKTKIDYLANQLDKETLDEIAIGLEQLLESKRKIQSIPTTAPLLECAEFHFGED